MKIELLGPLQAEIDGKSIVPSAARPCQVLALLALNSDHLISKSALLEELWGQQPPTSATTLHTYIHQLRRRIDMALGRGAALNSRHIIITGRNGYTLRLHGGTTDVQEYKRLSREGTAAFERGDFSTASFLLRQALAQWRSTVLADVPTGPLLSIEALSLEDSRSAVINRRIAADLRLGRHMEIMGEVRALVMQHPVDENYAAHYMVSLYQSGRIGDALAEYRRIRVSLSDELGVEPTEPLQRLHRTMLSGGQVLDDPRLATVR